MLSRGIRDTIIALGLGLFLFSVYLLSYRGGFHSVDEVSMYCVTESLVKRGRFDTDQVVWTEWTTTFSEAQGIFGPDGHVYSKKGLAISLVAAPLCWLALKVPGLGLLHTTFLLNAILTALTGSLMFLLVRRLDYTPAASLVTALVFGLGTIAWVYSKYFFSEPLSALLLLLAFLLALPGARHNEQVCSNDFNRWPRGRTTKVITTMGAGFVSGWALLSRANNGLIVPILILYILCSQVPGTSKVPGTWALLRRAWRPVVGYLFGLIPPLVVFALYNALKSGHPLQTGYDLAVFTPAYFWKGTFKLLLSPYRGLLFYMPVIVLCLVAFPRFFRKHPAEAGVCAAIPLSYLVLFSVWPSGEGLSWGPRFLVPTVPFIVIPLVSLLEDMYRCTALWKCRAPCIFLVFLSVVVQVLGVSINPQIHMMRLLDIFSAQLDTVEKLEGTAALYHPGYSPIWGQIQSMSVTNSDLAWLQPWGFDWVVLLAILALIALSGWTVVRFLIGSWKLEVGGWMVVVCLAAAMLVSGFSLGRYYRSDLQFGPLDNGYTRILAYLDQHQRSDDGLVTVAPYHYHIPMNRYKGRLPIYGFAQGQPEQQPFAEPLLERILAAHPRLWLVTSGLRPADPTNGVERWLAEHAFKAGDEWYDDFRLCPYASPPDQAGRSPLSVELGGLVALRGYGLYDARARPGDIVRLALYWEALAPLEKDYTVFVHLLDAAGSPRTQQDGPPGGGYRPTTSWAVGEEIADHRGLLLPEDIPAGTYQLAIGLYDGATGERLPVEQVPGTLEVPGTWGKDYILLEEVEVVSDG